MFVKSNGSEAHKNLTGRFDMTGLEKCPKTGFVTSLLHQTALNWTELPATPLIFMTKN